MKGGKRTGAGRKPCTDKKQQITIYVLTSQIEKLGKDTIRQVGEQVVADSVDGEEFDLDGNLPEDVKTAIGVMTENYVDIADFTSVVRFVKKDTTYYYLTF